MPFRTKISLIILRAKGLIAADLEKFESFSQRIQEGSLAEINSQLELEKQ
jgi:hypothetical protein